MSSTYYVFNSAVALLCFVILLKLISPSVPSKHALLLVLLVFLITLSFPFSVSFLSPLLSLLIALFFAVLAASLIYEKAQGLSGREAVEAVSLPREAGEQLLLPQYTKTAYREEVLFLPLKQANLKELINSAFQAKEENDLNLAVERFKETLILTEDITIKGMIYTELVFLYKELGKYLEAAEMVQKFVSQHSISFVPSLRNHFEKLVIYLKTVDELLKKANYSELPFSQVPDLIKMKAEKIYKE